jgi:hypothetical protein
MCTPRFHLFNLYTWELNFGQTIWDKTQVLLGTSWEHIWEHFKNKGKTQNNPCSPLPPLKKQPARFMKEVTMKPGFIVGFYYYFRPILMNQN